MPRNGRIENSEIHLATADQTNIAGRLLRWQIASRIQEGSSGSLPYPNTISCGHGSQVHSPKPFYQIYLNIRILKLLGLSLRAQRAWQSRSLGLLRRLRASQ